MSETSTGLTDDGRAGAIRTHAETLLATAQQARAAYHQLRNERGYNEAVALNLCWETQWTLHDYVKAHPSELGSLEWVSSISLTSVDVLMAITLPNTTDEATVVSDEFAQAFMDVMRRVTYEFIDFPKDVTWERGLPQIINRPHLFPRWLPADTARQDTDLTAGLPDVPRPPEPPDSADAASL